MKCINICSFWQRRKNLKSIIVKSENRTISSAQKMKCFLYSVHSFSHCLSFSVILLVTIAFLSFSFFFPFSSSSIPLLTGIHIYDASNLKEHTVSFCLAFTHSEQELCVCVQMYVEVVILFLCNGTEHVMEAKHPSNANEMTFTHLISEVCEHCSYSITSAQFLKEKILFPLFLYFSSLCMRISVVPLWFHKNPQPL